MFGKPEWFGPRKFGWGLGLRTKEGALYVVGAAALFAIAANLPIPMEQRVLVMGTLFVVGMADVLHIMTKVYSKLDEREQRHQLLAERNASFAAVAAAVGWIAYVTYTQAPTAPEQLSLAIMPAVAILVFMSVVKGATLLYLEKEA